MPYPKNRKGREVCQTCKKSITTRPLCNDERHKAVYRDTLQRSLLQQYRQRIRLIQFLGGKCANCGNADMRVLELNHKNGGGAKDYHSSSAFTVYREILEGKRSKDEYDVRCANCNVLYEYETGRRRTYDNT